MNGSVWTTDKDGIVPALLSAEITARLGRDPGVIYRELCAELGDPVRTASRPRRRPAQKQKLAALSAREVTSTELAGEQIVKILTEAPANGAAIGGLKVIGENGWFAARPSGTEDIYKIYAECFRGPAQLQRTLAEAQAIVARPSPRAAAAVGSGAAGAARQSCSCGAGGFAYTLASVRR